VRVDDLLDDGAHAGRQALAYEGEDVVVLVLVLFGGGELPVFQNPILKANG
jgi:hypothetical protein